MKLYADRDIMEQGQVYCDHVNQMTAEGLHAKSDIAAELAHRDIEIKRLSGAMAQIIQACAAPVNEIAQREAVHFAYATARDALTVSAGRTP